MIGDGGRGMREGLVFKFFLVWRNGKLLGCVLGNEVIEGVGEVKSEGVLVFGFLS